MFSTARKPLKNLRNKQDLVNVIELSELNVQRKSSRIGFCLIHLSSGKLKLGQIPHNFAESSSDANGIHSTFKNLFKTQHAFFRNR